MLGVRQGPPGTGKTFLGVHMVKAMLEAAKLYKQPIQILTLCFTNHALDQFLEELMDAGVPDTAFVRVGRSPKIRCAVLSPCVGVSDACVSL
jgi:superfamily II DNA or RNA helicase